MSERLFEQAYAQWLHARAAVADFDADPKALEDAGVDERGEAALAELIKAEWRFIEQPGSYLKDLRQRAEFVQQLFDASDEAGDPTDNRHRIALAGLVSEILRYSGDREIADAG
jgi:hypothetical protein